jgi:hypothetical protein
MNRVVVRASVVIGIVAVIAGAVLGLLAVWWFGVLVALVIAGVAGTFVGSRVGGAEDRVLRLVGAVRPARTGGDVGEARLLNLVEGLAPNAGLPRPRCLVVDDPAVNALTVGRDPRHGCLVMTSALLGSLSRMELEAVVAHGLVRLRDGGTSGPTLALAMTGPGSLLDRAVVEAPGPELVDLAAVALTRYPPGLLGALKVVAAAGVSAPAGASRVIGPLWLAPPGHDEDLQGRIAALQEL